MGELSEIGVWVYCDSRTRGYDGTWDLQYFLENLDSNSFLPSPLIPDPEPEVALRLPGKGI